MTEENATTKKTTARKTAPAITVKAPATRSTIDDLYRENPGKNFAYAGHGASDSSLGAQGLKALTDNDGKRVTVGNRVICEVVGDEGAKETAEQFKQAQEMAEAVRDPEKSSPDKSSVKRAPKKKKKK